MEKVLYYLSYDLINNRDYQKLYNELSEFKAKRVLESVWAFRYKRNNSALLRDHFKKFIDSDDRLIVVQSAGSSSRNLLYSPNRI